MIFTAQSRPIGQPIKPSPKRNETQKFSFSNEIQIANAVTRDSTGPRKYLEAVSRLCWVPGFDEARLPLAKLAERLSQHDERP